jgi:hypothetical protein
MSWEATDVKLVSGEIVKLTIDSVCMQDQTFVRMGKNLIAGIVNDMTWQGIYIWQEVDGVYVRLGDMVLREQEDGSVKWDLYTWVHNSIEFERRSAAHLAEQGKLHNNEHSTGNHISALSAAPGVNIS